MKSYTRAAAAAGMLILGMAVSYGGSFFYNGAIQSGRDAAASAVTEHAGAAQPAETEAETAAPTEAETAETEEETTAPAKPAPAADRFNLADLYPEDCEDPEDPMNSYGGKAFRSLYERDNDWNTTVFGASSRKPLQVAGQLGRSKESLMGKYNITDSTHDPDDPSTWVISKWKKITVNIVDGNGKTSPQTSNVKQILAMASVYSYYHDMEDHEAFENYARALWKASHSYSMSVSDVYYDTDCLTKEAVEKAIAKGDRLLPATPADASSPDEASVPAEGADGTTMDTSSESTEGSVETEAEEIGPGIGLETAGTSAAASAETAADPAGTENAETAPAAETAPSAAETSPVTAETAQTAAESAEAAAETGTETAQAGAENTQAGTETAQAGAEAAETGFSGEEVSTDTVDDIEKYQECPGHLDLNVRAVIWSMDGKKNLFTLDKIGSSKENFNDRWQGWTEETMAQARKLAEADWYEDYGLSVSLFSKIAPLTDSEVEEQLALLPEGLSEKRLALAETALRSIGRIPYYFGGKAVSADYDKNNFYSIVAPDYKGRIFRGLDCSGWLAWTYWSTFGTQLSASSTAGQIHLGRGIRRKDLQTGDIIIRAGSDETIGHVLMFLRWDESGQALCIHETGGVTNNVSFKLNQDTGASCRNLID